MSGIMAKQKKPCPRSTPCVEKIRAHAQEISGAFRNDRISYVHMLLGLLASEAGTAFSLLNALGVDREAARKEIFRDFRLGRNGNKVETCSHGRGDEVLDCAESAARDFGYGYVGSEHILFSLLRCSCACIPWERIAPHAAKIPGDSILTLLREPSRKEGFPSPLEDAREPRLGDFAKALATLLQGGCPDGI